jgi:hypothetical protein
MAKAKTAEEKAAVAAAKKAAKTPVAPVVGSSVAGEEETQSATEAEVSKDFSSITGTGKFVVVEVKKDTFRMYNEVGKAVSPLVGRADVLESGKSALAKLIRDAHRSNALRAQREIRIPRGHEAKE